MRSNESEADGDSSAREVGEAIMGAIEITEGAMVYWRNRFETWPPTRQKIFELARKADGLPKTSAGSRVRLPHIRFKISRHNKVF